jgi:hypothetical protein
MALFTTCFTTEESAVRSVALLTVAERAEEVAFYQRQASAGRYFGETTADVAARQADARWWLAQLGVS